jgi:hypothetical protein
MVELRTPQGRLSNLSFAKQKSKKKCLVNLSSSFCHAKLKL